MTRSRRASAARATDREVLVVAAVLVAGSEKAAAHRLGLPHSTVGTTRPIVLQTPIHVWSIRDLGTDDACHRD